MKVFPYENMSYFDAVQAFLLELTGRGIVLSGRDVQLLVDWRRRGASTAAVCRGLEQAVREMRDPPRDIWACRYHIEPLVASVKVAAVVGQKEVVEKEDIRKATLDRIADAGREASRDAFKDAYRAAWKRVRDVEEDDVFEQVLEIEDALLARYWDALELAEQRRVLEQIASEVGDLGQMSEIAQEQHEHARRRSLLQAEYGLIRLLEL